MYDEMRRHMEKAEEAAWQSHQNSERNRMKGLYSDYYINENPREDAMCDRPCGQEPLGCSTCDSAFGVNNFVPREDVIFCGDFECCDECPGIDKCPGARLNK